MWKLSLHCLINMRKNLFIRQLFFTIHLSILPPCTAAPEQQSRVTLSAPCGCVTGWIWRYWCRLYKKASNPMKAAIIFSQDSFHRFHFLVGLFFGPKSWIFNDVSSFKIKESGDITPLGIYSFFSKALEALRGSARPRRGQEVTKKCLFTHCKTSFLPCIRVTTSKKL